MSFGRTNQLRHPLLAVVLCAGHSIEISDDVPMFEGDWSRRGRAPAPNRWTTRENRWAELRAAQLRAETVDRRGSAQVLRSPRRPPIVSKPAGPH